MQTDLEQVIEIIRALPVEDYEKLREVIDEEEKAKREKFERLQYRLERQLIWKHSVETEEVREIFLNNPKFRFIEKGHRKDENVYAVFGRTDAGRYLVCFFVHKTDKRALILSARDMTETERKRYSRK